MVLPLGSLLLIGAAAVVLHVVTRELRPTEIRAALITISAEQITMAALFTVASFVALASFDVLAVGLVAPGALLYRRAAIAGALGHAVTNVLGFGVLTGGALRYRIYSSAGLDAADILRVIAITYLTYLFGFLTLFGLALVIDPVELVPLRVLGAPAEIVLGAAILIALALFVLWTGVRPRAIAIRGWSIFLPTSKVAAGQILAGSIDVAASGAVLYVLLPPEVQPALPYFLVAYASAIILGIISHAPGGLGVFEATMVGALGPEHGAGVIAALIVYRLVYYASPFTIAVVALAGYEAAHNRHWLSTAAGETMRLVRPIVPMVAAAMVFLAGLVLLISGVLPAEKSRLGVLQEFLPLPIVEMSHLLGSIAGMALLIVSAGLARRFRTAWLVTLILVAGGAIASLARGLDFESATIMAIVAAILFAFRSAFYRRRHLSEFRLSPAWLALVIGGVVAVTWLGLFSHRHVVYANELWWQFAWSGDAPRFLRATVAVSAVLAWAAVGVLTRQPFLTRFEPDPITEPIQHLVAASPHTQSNIALLGDKKFLLAPDHSAFLMYGRSGRSFVSMGEPVGAAGPAAVELIWRLREMADESGCRAIYYAVGSAYLSSLLDMGLSVFKIGEIARVDLATFSLDGKNRRDFRHADRRAEKEGWVFEVIPKEQIPRHLPELRAISEAWLTIKSGHEKGFSLGFFSEDYLANFDCAVMRDGAGILGFANVWRGADRAEISVDLMRYRPHAASFLMDALFARLLLHGKAEGYRWFNLGAAPLAGLESHPLASTWNKLGNLLYRHGEDFYHFEGLKAFKLKFAPVWSAQYIAGPGGFALPSVLFDITALISRGRLGVLVK